MGQAMAVVWLAMSYSIVLTDKQHYDSIEHVQLEITQDLSDISPLIPVWEHSYTSLTLINIIHRCLGTCKMIRQKLLDFTTVHQPLGQCTMAVAKDTDWSHISQKNKHGSFNNNYQWLGTMSSLRVQIPAQIYDNQHIINKRYILKQCNVLISVCYAIVMKIPASK